MLGCKSVGVTGAQDHELAGGHRLHVARRNGDQIRCLNGQYLCRRECRHIVGTEPGDLFGGEADDLRGQQCDHLHATECLQIGGRQNRNIARLKSHQLDGRQSARSGRGQCRGLGAGQGDDFQSRQSGDLLG